MGQCHTHRINGVTIDCDSLVEFEAERYVDAYQAANEIFERRWCGLYEPNKTEFSLYPRGVVLQIKVDRNLINILEGGAE